MEKLSKKSFINSRNLIDIFINKAKNALWFLGENAFLFILIFVLLGMLYGEFLFYKYVFLLRIENPEFTFTTIKFQKDVYDSVLKEWQTREDIFNDSSYQNYSDPF